MKNKKTIFLILATVAMVALSVIAVLTSLRLKELATVPVAPNVPESQPMAAELTVSEVAFSSCELSFTVEAPTYACFETGCLTNADCEPLADGTALICDLSDEVTQGRCVNPSCTDNDNCLCESGLLCFDKILYADDDRNTAGSYYLDDANELEDGTEFSRGDTFLYGIYYLNNGDLTNSATITDVLPDQVEFVDADGVCEYDIASHTVTCTTGLMEAGQKLHRAIRAKVKSDVAAGVFENTAVVTPEAGDESTCVVEAEVVIATTPTPTPTPTPTETPVAPTCNSYCANDSECPSGLICSWNKCRNSACVDDNDCECTVPPGCNETCNPDNATNECAGGYICDEATNTCRNSACTGETDCTCAVVAGTTQTTETLPTAGSPIPSFLFLAGGALLVILGVLAVGL